MSNRSDVVWQEAMQRLGNLPGGAVMTLVAGGQVVRVDCCGLSDIEAGRAMAPDRVFRIGSVTKPITGLMLMQLVETGRLDLDAPVADWLPQIADIDGYPADSPVTFRQLAQMSSGLVVEPENLDRHLVGPVDDWERVLLSALPDVRFTRPAGVAYEYSNIGYALLGAACARAAGRPYVDYVAERILAPLGLAETTFTPGPDLQSRFAAGYHATDGRLDPGPPRRQHAGRGYKIPNGGLYSSISDLARLAAFFLGHGPQGVVEPATLAAATDQFFPLCDDKCDSYGIGMMIWRPGGRTLVGHGGGVDGYRSCVAVDRAADVGIAILRNVNNEEFNASVFARGVLVDMIEACES